LVDLLLGGACGLHRDGLRARRNTSPLGSALLARPGVVVFFILAAHALGGIGLKRAIGSLILGLYRLRDVGNELDLVAS